MEKVKFNTPIPSLEQAKKDIWDKMLKNQKVKDFINQNEIPSTIINENLGHFVTYLENCDRCNNCKSFFSCQKEINGLDCDLVYNKAQGTIRLEFHHCELYLQYLKLKNNFIYYEYDESLFDANNIRLDTTPERIKVIERMGDLMLNKPVKGLYLWGKSGIGKSYLLAIMGLKFTQMGKKCAFIKSSTLISNLRSLLDLRKTSSDDEDVSFQSELERYKKVEVLILDDWGGEKMSEWIRDEIWYPLLDYRSINKNLITCFTGNYSLDDYKRVITLKDEVKAERLTSRIRMVAEEYELIGINRR